MHYAAMTRARGSGRRHETARRSIHFFRLDGGADTDGVPTPVDLRPALKRVDGLPFRRDGGRYLARGDARLCAWIDDTDRICRLRFASVRDNALPQMEARGILSDLDIADDGGLCETSHMCVFPDGIVGMEFNFHGPRPSRFADYLRATVPDESPAFAMEGLLRQNIAAELENKRAVRTMILRVRRSYVDVIAEADLSLGHALRAGAQAGNADCVGLYLEPEAYQRHDLSVGVLSFLKRMVTRRDLHEHTREFRAKVVDHETDKVDPLDLLNDQLISHKKICKQHRRTRVLDREDAYEKIEEAYDERREELLIAASVTAS